MSEKKSQQLVNSKFGTAIKFDKLIKEAYESVPDYDYQRWRRLSFFGQSFVETKIHKSDLYEQFITKLPSLNNTNYSEQQLIDLIELGYLLINANDVAFVTVINDLYDEVYF